jgi:MGT family glycosyltransferase
MKRRHVLFLSLPVYGHVYPSLTVAEELTRRGHRVTFATAETFAGEVARSGVELLAYTEELSAIPAELSDDADTIEVSILSLKFYERSLRELPALATRFGDDPPTVVVCDPLTFGAGVVLSRDWAVPLVVAHPNLAFNETFNWPAARRGEILDDPRRDLAVELETSLGKLFGEHGLDEGRLYRGDDPAIVYAPKALQPHAESFGDSYAFVGPSTDGTIFAGDWPPPAGPMLFISLGTQYNERPASFRLFAEAFGGLDWQVVVSLGGARPPAGPVPDNFQVHPWVPQLAVLDQASVFVSNGGLGGITSALRQGTPMVLAPEAAEQEMHAGRVVELGLGRVVRLAELTAAELRQVVLDLAADEATAGRLAAMRSLAREAGGTRRAAEVIESA